MKIIKSVLCLAVCLFSAYAGFSQSTGKVYLLRATGYTGSAVNYSFFVDDQLICKQKNKTFSIHDLSAGEHTISVSSGGLSTGKKSNPLKITVVEGKVNYISVVSTQAGYANKITCQEITENSAQPIIAISKEIKKCL